MALSARRDGVSAVRSDRRPQALVGDIRVPGDKSVSHRALIVGGLAAGPSRVIGANLGHDVLSTASVLTGLGARCRVIEGKSEVEVHGCGWDACIEPDDVLDAGNSGTTLRLMLGVCAGLPLATILTGDASLRRRPMFRIVEPLRAMGAFIDGRHSGDRAPLLVRGGRLHGIDWTTPVASAQVKSGLLLAALKADGRTCIEEPALSRDHTERMLEAAGVPIVRKGLTVTVNGPADVVPTDRRICGDLSAAVFFVVAAALVPKSRLTIRFVGLNPTRAGSLDILREMGAALDVAPAGDESGEPVGDVAVTSSALRGVDIDLRLVPSAIDEIPILAVAATQAEGETVIRGASELRLKETDRLGAMAHGLNVLGADVQELPDGLIVRGPGQLSGGEVDSFGDHRIAMAFAVAGLVASERVVVKGWSCVDTSFPGFLDVLARAQGRR
jgi:3-phosphoshikimate 1-carboxyvinyltransferase